MVISPVYGLVILAVLIHAVISYRAYRLGREAAEGSLAANRDAETDGADHESGVVDCPDCDTANEVGYRYCRSCVAELPGAMEFDRSIGGGVGRFAE